MDKHQELADKAIGAVMEIYEDKSVDQETMAETLQWIIEKIQDLIEALK